MPSFKMLHFCHIQGYCAEMIHIFLPFILISVNYRDFSSSDNCVNLNTQVTGRRKMNQIVLVGQVKETPSFRETNSGTKLGTMLLEVERTQKNPEGGHDKDVFAITLWRNLASECENVIRPGMSVGIKGRLTANNYLKGDEIRYNSDIIAERVSIYHM